MTGPLLSELTTSRVGGPAERVLAPATRRELVETARELFDSREPFLIVGGGSNLIVADEGFEGAVLRIVTRGVELADLTRDDAGSVVIRVEAGEPWADLVDATVARGWSGLEALAGIPGCAGAAPVQNIGAYGQEVSRVLRRVEFLDAESGELAWLDAAELELGYRSSLIKHGELRGLVTRIELELIELSPEHEAVDEGAPVQYAQLAKALGVEVGDRVPAARIRDAVLRLRRSKGMVLDPGDPDSVSTGSFFVNPVVSRSFAVGLPEEAPRFEAPHAPDGTPLVKLSAAWLIEHAGVRRGFSLPGSGAAISSKHTLAIVNRRNATAEQIVELARYVRLRVEDEFGVHLVPEPILVGLEL